MEVTIAAVYSAYILSLTPRGLKLFRSSQSQGLFFITTERLSNRLNTLWKREREERDIAAVR